MNTDNTTGYQSSAFNDDMHNVNIAPSDDDTNEPRGYVPQERRSAAPLGGVSTAGGSYIPSSSLEELLPESMSQFAFLDVFIPKISRYVGTNLLQYFYVIAFVGGIFLAIINMFGMIINAFRVHWTLGLFSFIYSVVLGLGAFLVYIVALRLLVEFLMSVFVIRERLTRLVSLKEIEARK